MQPSLHQKTNSSDNKLHHLAVEKYSSNTGTDPGGRVAPGAHPPKIGKLCFLMGFRAQVVHFIYT
jgi:hypothetical protein